jgi:TBC1 domain family member 14
MVLSENNPEIYAKLHDLGVTSDHYLLDWFMTLFTRKLPLRICTRVWDLFLVAGEIVLHKVAVAVMKLHKRSLMECDFEECVKELAVDIDSLDEGEFFSLVDSVKVNPHWSGILERFQQQQKSPSRPSTLELEEK